METLNYQDLFPFIHLSHLRINRTFVISATSSMLFKPQIAYIYKDYFLDPERKQDRKAHGER